MFKEHKKSYKAGKLWLTATLMVLAGITVGTSTGHADSTVVNQAVSPVAATNEGTAQGPRVANPANEPGATGDAQPSLPMTPADQQGDGEIDSGLQAQIAAAQQAVDEQRQVVANDETTLASARQERDQTAQAAKTAVAKAKEVDAQYQDADAEANAAYKKWQALSAKAAKDTNQPEYQALLQRAKAICPGYYSSDLTTSLDSYIKLRQQSEEQYQEFNNLLAQMRNLLTPQAVLDQAWHDYETKRAAENTVWQADLAASKAAEQADQAAQQAYNNWVKRSDQLRNDNQHLADLINQLAALKQKELTELQKHNHLLEITYVDREGNVVGTKQLAGKNGEDVTSVVRQAPAGYHYAGDPQKSFKIADSNRKVTVVVDQDTAQPTLVREQVNYVAADGQLVGSQTLSGQPGQQFIAGSLQLPAGYRISQEGPLLITLGNTDGQLTVRVSKATPDRPVDMRQNYGYLDSYSAQQGKLHLTGWHVSSASADYRYPYIIVLDNGREVGRAQAHLVDRPDVDRLYPNTTGRQAAGFTADVAIPTYAYGDRLTVIARFSNDPAGNGQYQDYYFNNLKPVTDLNANKASLDGYHLSTNSRNGDIQLNVAGWHAAGRSVTETNHWLILFDNTTNSEIQRVKLSDADNYVVSRPDVARAFPGIANSGQSGFDGTFTLSRAELGHNLSVVARYSDDAVNGEGNRTDCWLAVPRLVNSQVNAGWVDNYHAERGTNGTGIDLVVSGWHVAGNSLSQPYHWVILYDNDTHQEVIRMPIKGQASDFYGNSHFATQPILRPDVARQYQNVLDSNRSGFEARFALLQSTSQHSLSIISRYSDDATNGEGNHTDYWMSAMRLDQGNHANLENISLSGNQLRVSGWHATNQLGTDKHVIILYDATQHRELGRQTVGRLARPDVAKAFPTIYNAADSGFSAAFDFQPEMAHDQIQIVSRWTSAGSENSDYVDYWFAPQLLVSDQSNRASLDAFNLSNGQLTATGWHASNQALGKQHHYVILFDQTTGQELSRVETPLVQRPDVARAFPTILNAGDSGFNVNFAFDPAQLDGHRLAIVSRWTTDPAGNGNATDYWFAPQTFTVTQPTSRAVRGTGDGVGALDKWAVFINPALSSDNSNRIFFFASGWHASNAVTGRPYHDIMLIDNTTGQQVGGATYGNPMLPARDTSRPDIARLYGNQYQNAGESGFKIGLQTPRFTFGHRYTLVSRYASDENGSNAVQQSYYLGQINQDMVNYGDGHDFFN